MAHSNIQNNGASVIGSTKHGRSLAVRFAKESDSIQQIDDCYYEDGVGTTSHSYRVLNANSPQNNNIYGDNY